MNIEYGAREDENEFVKTVDNQDGQHRGSMSRNIDGTRNMMKRRHDETRVVLFVCRTAVYGASYQRR